MPATSHQTVRLSRGRHRTPQDGACVMELASLLAGERFSDYPASVCPLIGAFLRTYNDSVDDDRRADLYACAATVVGTGGRRSGTRGRACRLRAVAHELAREKPGRAQRSLAGMQLSHVARALAAQGEPGHARALALVTELAGPGRVVAPAAPDPWGDHPSAAVV
ncbi:MAG: hypothetical protein E6G10_06660 [Actinobacteria bacterium]|nr:MAG: hypothetical protein E6G10_06660 [Actinomycetota bacterium]